MAPIVQRMGLFQKRTATTRQMMPTVIKSVPPMLGDLRQPRLYPSPARHRTNPARRSREVARRARDAAAAGGMTDPKSRLIDAGYILRALDYRQRSWMAPDG